MDGFKRSLMAIGYNNDFKVNSELSDVRNADDASHAAKIVIIALKMMLVTTLVAGIVLVDGDDRFADLFRNMKW